MTLPKTASVPERQNIIFLLHLSSNTWYMQDALDELRRSGQEVRPEDVERLAPLRFQHINVQGKYHFTLPESVVQGNHRPLRQPSSSPEELF